MSDNEGYINIVAVMQKYFDLQLAETGVIIPTKFDNNEVPNECIDKRLLTTYTRWVGKHSTIAKHI